MSSPFDRVVFTVTAGGTGTWTVSAAVTGYRTLVQAGVPDNAMVTYVAESSDKSQWEEGLGRKSGSTLERTVVRRSSNSDALVNFSAAPTVFVDLQQEEVTLIGASVHALHGGL